MWHDIPSSIKLDEPTDVKNHIYTREIVEPVILQFNAKAQSTPIKGGKLNRKHIHRCTFPIFYTRKLFINDNNIITAQVRFSHFGYTMEKKYLENPENFRSCPVMSVPAYVSTNVEKESKEEAYIVPIIYEIIRVQMEILDNE